MARPSDISTKVISFRVPMRDYIKLLTLATEKGLSISDYMLMRVYGPDGEITKGKSLAGTEQELTAGPDPGQVSNLESIQQPKLEKEITLSGVPKRPHKQQSSPKADITVKAKKVAEKSIKEASKPRSSKAVIAKSKKPTKTEQLQAKEEKLSKMIKKMVIERQHGTSSLEDMKAADQQAKKAYAKIDALIKDMKQLGWKKQPDAYIEIEANQAFNNEKNSYDKPLGAAILTLIKK